jgi:hypothetical protein
VKSSITNTIAELRSATTLTGGAEGSGRHFGILEGVG